MMKRSRACLAAIAFIFGSYSPLSHAIAAIPTSGTCAFLSNSNYPFVYIYGSSPGTFWGINFIGTLNFTNDTAAINGVIQNPAGASSAEFEVQGTGTFTVNTSSVLSGAYDLVLTLSSVNAVQPSGVTLPSGTTLPSSAKFSFHVVPTNGGNTLLMQQVAGASGSADGGFTGVCQF